MVVINNLERLKYFKNLISECNGDITLLYQRLNMYPTVHCNHVNMIAYYKVPAICRLDQNPHFFDVRGECYCVLCGLRQLFGERNSYYVKIEHCFSSYDEWCQVFEQIQLLLLEVLSENPNLSEEDILSILELQVSENEISKVIKKSCLSNLKDTSLN